MAGLADFSVEDLESLSRRLRDLGVCTPDVVAAAREVADPLHGSLCRPDGSAACVAVSVHKTHPSHLLPVGRDRPSERSARSLRALTPAVKVALIPHALHPWPD